MNTFFTLIAIYLFTGSAWGEPLKLDFEELKTRLQQRNVKVEANRLEVDAAKNREGTLGRSFLPTLEIYGAQENFKKGKGSQKNQPTYGAAMQVNLFNGGRDKLQSQIRDLTTSQKEVRLALVFADELQKARNLYWEIIFTANHMALIDATNQINGENLKAAQKRIRSGVATESDRFEFEMKSVDLNRDRAEAQIKWTRQKGELALLLGLDAGTELQLPSQLSHEHEFEPLLAHSAKDHEFLYKENEIQANVSSLAAESQARTWWPKLDAYAAYNQFNEREEEFPNAADRIETVVGVRMSLSLGSAFESRRESAALTREAAGLQKLADYQRQETEVHLAAELAELQLRHSQVHDADENIQRAEKYDRLTKSEYGRGVKNSPDVLGASEKLFEMKLKRLEIIRDFQISKAHVLAKIGR